MPPGSLFFGYEIYSLFPQNRFIDFFMIFVTKLGNEDFLIFLLVILFWLGNLRMVAVLHLAFFLSYFVNSVLKAYFAMPRPALEFLPLGIQSLALKNLEISPGMPSGHAQIAITVYLLLAFFVKNRVFKFVLYSLAFLIPISRLYLGVHFLGDVLVGMLLGFLIVVIAWFYGESYLQKQSEYFFIFTVLWITFVLTVAAWYGDKGIFVSGGSLLGYLVFVTLAIRQNMAEKKFPIMKKFNLSSSLFFLVCLFLIFFLRSFLKWLLPSWPLSDLVRYFLLVGFAGYLVPLLHSFLFKEVHE